ncbi:aspartic protein-like protein 1 [Dorcoceras hygrometricum]|uniref:Aspartic protein-like protein 1 n=1 Tax=Dorcoceras hygrometricum TaxID=472368 RepID=A0A2Z7BWT8_9LAMI|nr:aspartic protein-like protein 1 [Dorcoceras hygrometricum]
MYPVRLVHRFSDEAREVMISRNGADVVNGSGAGGTWPQKRSSEYYRRLLSSDVQRQTLKLNPQFQYLYPTKGSATLSLGNDFGWLHYMWIDIGTPSVSFLVALDAGSDLFWIPCDCVECAPLAASYYSSLDKDLNEYNPSDSSTSKPLSCRHQLCELGPNCPNPKQQCPYTVNYYSDDTSTSGFLVEDVFHLMPGHNDASNESVKAPIIIGCGSKQTGGYLNGVAPDGLLGLGLGEISVPSFLAKSGYVSDSFSLCFNEDDSGRLFFGDRGISGQQTTPFLSLDGKNLTYVVGVDACCIESSCLEHTGFEMLVDSGTSFSFFPIQVYKKVVDEFDRQINASRSSFEGYPWQYCYKSSSNVVPKFPSLVLKFSTNSSFAVSSPVFVIYGTQGAVGFCLAVQPTDGNLGTFGQNFMTGYQIVFDREKYVLGWSHSKCLDLKNGDGGRVGNSNTLPTTEQQSVPRGHAIAPAFAGRTPTSSASCFSHTTKLFMLMLLMVHVS